MSDEHKGEVTKRPDGFQVRESVQFRTDMIGTQQKALEKTMDRYQARDNPIEQFVETVTVKAVDAFLNLNERIVGMLPNDTRLKVQDAWQKLMLSF